MKFLVFFITSLNFYYIFTLNATIVHPEWYYDETHIKGDTPLYLLEDKNPLFQELVKEKVTHSKESILSKFKEKLFSQDRLRFTLVGITYEVTLKELAGRPNYYIESASYEQPEYEWVLDILNPQEDAVSERRNALFISFWEDAKGKNLFCNFFYTTDPRLVHKSVMFINDLELSENDAPVGSIYEYFSGRFRIHKKDDYALQKAAFFRRHSHGS